MGGGVYSKNFKNKIKQTNENFKIKQMNLHSHLNRQNLFPAICHRPTIEAYVSGRQYSFIFYGDMLKCIFLFII